MWPFRRKKRTDLMYLNGILEEVLRYYTKIKAGEDFSESEIAHFHLLASEVERLMPSYHPLRLNAQMVAVFLDLKYGIK